MGKNLGKRKMNSIMAQETGIPYRDVAVYGRYMPVGDMERLVIGPYELKNSCVGVYITEPDYSDDEPKYVTRKIEMKGVEK